MKNSKSSPDRKANEQGHLFEGCQSALHIKRRDIGVADDDHRGVETECVEILAEIIERTFFGNDIVGGRHGA